MKELSANDLQKVLSFITAESAKPKGWEIVNWRTVLHSKSKIHITKMGGRCGERDDRRIDIGVNGEDIAAYHYFHDEYDNIIESVCRVEDFYDELKSKHSNSKIRKALGSILT